MVRIWVRVMVIVMGSVTVIIRVSNVLGFGVRIGVIVILRLGLEFGKRVW